MGWCFVDVDVDALCVWVCVGGWMWLCECTCECICGCVYVCYVGMRCDTKTPPVHTLPFPNPPYIHSPSQPPLSHPTYKTNTAPRQHLGFPTGRICPPPPPHPLPHHRRRPPPPRAAGPRGPAPRRGTASTSTQHAGVGQVHSF